MVFPSYYLRPLWVDLLTCGLLVVSFGYLRPGYGPLFCFCLSQAVVFACEACARDVGLSLLCPGCGLDFIWLVFLLACMWGLVFGLSLLCSGCGLGFIWLVFLLAYGGFVRGRCPFPMFIREVLSVFCFFWWPWLLYSSWLFVGLCPFGNKFLIIQKKRSGNRISSKSGTNQQQIRN